MPWFTRSKKFRTPSKRSASFRIPTHIAIGPLGFGVDLDLDVDPDGFNDEGGSRISLLNRGTSRQHIHTPETATPTPGNHDSSAASQEPEREVSSSSQYEHLDQDPLGNFCSTEGELEVQKQAGHGDRGTVAHQPPDPSPQPSFNNNLGNEDTIEDRMNEKQNLPALETGTSRVDGGIEYGNDPDVFFPSTENSSGVEGGEIEPTEESKSMRQTTMAFGPLEAVLRTMRTLCTNREGSIDIRNKVNGLLSQIVALRRCFNSRLTDAAEQKRRNELLHGFGCIEEQLRSLSEKPELRSEDISRPLEDIRETIFDYQMALQMEMYDQRREEMDPAEASVLYNFRSARGAEHRHGNRKGCLKGTRVAVLDEIELWARDFDKSPVYWLNGLAGTGKTAIAQTIAERIFADGQLGASFFCSRDFEDRSDLKSIFPTLAVQLALNYTEFRAIFVPLVRRDLEISSDSLYNQMDKLIVRPLKESDISTVIVIDALDECKDEESASAILSVLGRFVSKIPKVKFFLTGRPEPRIRTGFRLPLLARATDVFVLHNVEQRLVDNDILLFLKHSFLEISDRRGGIDGWPTREDIDLLRERSAGLFVYAVATVRFVDYKNYDPKRQLELLLRSPGSSTRQGKTRVNAKATLDSLYTSILREAFGNDDQEDDHKVHSILGAVTLAVNPLSPSTIATLLGFDTIDVSLRLSSAHSLLILQDDINQPVRPFHKSFPDFITDPARCTSPRFRVSPPNQHAELLVGCLELMNRRLERNMCGLPDGVTNVEVGDLRERADEHIDQATQYACRSWHKHLIGTVPDHTREVTPVLHQFLEKKFLFWLEVLSVLGDAREAVDALDATAKWLDVSPTLDLVDDYFRFVLAFFDVISTSAPHIYHSALPLSPRSSIVRELHHRYSSPLARITHGLPMSWEPVAATTYDDNSGSRVEWSPCHRFVALAGLQAVQILDAVTFKPLNTFEHPPYSNSLRLSFSPDTRFLTQIVDGSLTTWDLQTGGPVGIIPSGVEAFLTNISSTYSSDGEMLAAAYMNMVGAPTFTIATYNLLSRMYTRSCRVSEGSMITPIWTHDDYLRFATVKQGSIAVWEVSFTLIHTPEEVEFFPAPDEAADGVNFQFLPALSRLAFNVQDTIFVWDAKASKFLLESGSTKPPGFVWTPKQPRFYSRGSFSPDGRFFACSTATQEVFVWKESLTGYLLHQKLALANANVFKVPVLSPNGESIILPSSPTIHRWHTSGQILSPPSAPSWHRDPTHGFILKFSPNETSAAFSRVWGDTVVIIDLQSGDQRLVIDTGMKIYCLGVAGSTVVVADQKKIVTWGLPARNSTPNARANTSDSLQTTIFDRSLPSRSLQPPNLISISPNLSHAVVTGLLMGSPDAGLEVYEVSTGRCLAGTTTTHLLRPGFSPDGQEVWEISLGSSMEGWKIAQDSKSGATELEPLKSTARPSEVLPWRSPRGYEVTHDGWVVSPSQKRLLWLPHHWRSGESYRTWSGRFLGLTHNQLQEVVILEFFE